MTNSIEDLDVSDVILVIGSNTTEAHPVIGARLRQAARRGAEIHIIDPREIELRRHATRWLPVHPGRNVAVINAMLKVIVTENLYDPDFIEQRTIGFTDLSQALASIALDNECRYAGVEVEDVRTIARAYATAARAAIVYSMGVTQHSDGTAQVRALANLAMATGQIGRPGAGVFPLRGQNNVQGCCDMGCLPNKLPGYRDAQRCGLAATEMYDAVLAGDVRAMYIIGEDPAISEPNRSHVVEALASLDLLVVHDIFPTETTSLAHVVLPAASYLEKSGTFVNTERRVQLVNPVAPPPGQAKSDGEIISLLSEAFGHPAEFDSEKIMEQIAAEVPSYAGISHARLRAEGGLQWPCTDDEHPGTPILHMDEFASGVGRFCADILPSVPAEEGGGGRDATSFTLTTGRSLWNFHAKSMTGRAPGLSELDDGDFVEINALDARLLTIENGQPVVLTSAYGSLRTTARVCSERSPRPGTIFMTFHHADAPVNVLTGGPLDPVSKIPPLKSVSVTLVPA